MKIKLFESINRNQRGFTLIELLVTIAITAILSSGVTMTVFQLFNSNTRSTAHMSAIKQVESAVHWVSLDTQMSQIVDADPSEPNAVLKLQWTEWDNTVNDVTYTLTGGELKRKHNTQVPGSETEVSIAQHITDDTNFTFDSGSSVLTFVIKASLGTPAITETRKGEIKPRAVL